MSPLQFTLKKRLDQFSSRWLFVAFSCSFVNDFLSAAVNLTSLSPSLKACEQSLFYLFLLYLLFHGKSLFSVQSIFTGRKGSACCRVHPRQSHATVQWREMTSSIPSKDQILQMRGNLTVSMKVSEIQFSLLKFSMIPNGIQPRNFLGSRQKFQQIKMVETRRLGGLSAMEIHEIMYGQRLSENYKKSNTSINLFTTETCPARDGRLFFESGQGLGNFQKKNFLQNC